VYDAGRELVLEGINRRNRDSSISMATSINPLPPSDTVRKQEKFILENLSSSVLTQFKKMSSLWKPEL